MDLETARKQASEYAMALDLLARISQSDSENEVVAGILDLFNTLFSPQSLFYVSLSNGEPDLIYPSSLSEDDGIAIKERLIKFDRKYAWTETGKGFLLKISHKGAALGILQVDEISFPEYKEHYLNLALSLINVCGLMIENARRYQKIKDNERRLQEEKEKAEDALSKVKKLSGLLPICSFCKKIRDGKGYWNQIEAYIRENSEADFSHSVCQECAKKYYPDIDIYDD